MRCVNVVVCLVSGMAILAAAGCGRSSALSGPDEPAAASTGAAVLQGALVAPSLTGLAAVPSGPGAGFATADSVETGWVVSVAGTPLSSGVDFDGRFVLEGLPAGSVTLRVQGPGVSAEVAVSGLVDRLVTSVEIRITGGGAELAGAPQCSSSAETYFSGSLDRLAGTELVVAGRRVDASQIVKVWRGERRIELEQLVPGELVKVWGVLRGDGVVLAEEIKALTSGAQTFISFSGRVDYAGAGFAGPGMNPSPVCCPTLKVAGYTVYVKPETRVWHSNGDALDACAIKQGWFATIDGWKQTDGSVKATRIIANP